jgi:hypothetical protein
MRHLIVSVNHIPEVIRLALDLLQLPCRVSSESNIKQNKESLFDTIAAGTDVFLSPSETKDRRRFASSSLALQSSNVKSDPQAPSPFNKDRITQNSQLSSLQILSDQMSE